MPALRAIFLLTFEAMHLKLDVGKISGEGESLPPVALRLRN